MDIHEMLFDDRPNGKKSQHFEDNGNILIVITSKNVRRVYKRRNINLSEERAKELAKDLRKAYKVKTRAVKQSPNWSVFVERQTWGGN